MSEGLRSDVLLCTRAVILQGSGAAKYNGGSLVAHSGLMKSGPAQEERHAAHSEHRGCGGSAQPNQ